MRALRKSEIRRGQDTFERMRVRSELLELTDLPDFRPYRLENALQRLPEPERAEWRVFWPRLRLVLGKRRPLR